MRSLAITLAALVCAAGAWAAPAKEAYIYRGTAVNQEGITLGSWGSGRAAESKDKVLTGSYSVKITTQGFYSGGLIDFQQPVTLYSEGATENRYIVFTFFFNDTQTVNPAAGTNAAFDVQPYTIPKVNTIRFVFESDGGAKIPITAPTREVDPDDNWVRVDVPLMKLKRPETDRELRMKRLLIFSDIPSAFYLGEIKLVTDTESIKVDSLGSQVVAVYDEVFLVAEAKGGVSALKYSWDFDKRNGIQEEWTGKVGRYTYTRGGEYAVTLTVSDDDGIKTPAKAEANISVND